VTVVLPGAVGPRRAHERATWVLNTGPGLCKGIPAPPSSQARNGGRVAHGDSRITMEYTAVGGALASI
jgi:hypothetical protein